MIDYPKDKELRRLLAEELRKLQESTPERKKTAEAAEHWQENANKIVERLQMTMPHLMNCPHSSDSWCLDCVQKQWEELYSAQVEKNNLIQELIDWVNWRIDEEVKNRPEQNIYKKTLMDTWNQIKRKLESYERK